ncbi:MAG: hypothetical protein D5R97_08020 [Candidatus Syntrophonatronum acetioxidans]|uniref:Uncharacterized protein n=1 Tax=Candidatus Syntrophonatronum acetioxidans TaxID=1795816 RepID=A0A424YBE1_9FIRM|nr:MAG: hypothetical protein D5R97_08020 [Candidatus Syntrophonatronum acetioxidans]
MKKPLIILSVFFLVLFLGAGLWGYNYFFGFDQELDRQLEEEFGADFFYAFDLEEPLLEMEELEAGEEEREKFTPSPEENIDREEEEEKEEEKEPTSKDREDKKREASPERNKEKDSDPGREKDSPSLTEEEVMEKYLPQIRSLESQASKRLEDLFASAYREYAEGKEAGEKIEGRELARKYIQAGNKLEAGVDAAFKDILARAEKELNKHNLATDIIQEAKKEYDQAKRERRSELLNKAREVAG